VDWQLVLDWFVRIHYWFVDSLLVLDWFVGWQLVYNWLLLKNWFTN